jgi:hypothetical protein
VTGTKKKKVGKKKAPKKKREKGIELPSGTVIRCDGPHGLCLSTLGSVLSIQERLFYNLDDAQDRNALADRVIETWERWAEKGKL